MADAGFYLVATPIGNLRDITLRALDVLKTADVIVCEDTRHTRKLLTHYGIQKRLIACEKFSEAAGAEAILGMIAEGRRVAYVSDAGTPAVSDPGALLVRRLRASGVRIEVVPGPCALIAALSGSGFDGNFRFVGFLPRKIGELKNVFSRVMVSGELTLGYESPHRIARTLAVAAEILGDREICIARELSKLHEDFMFGTASELIERLTELPAVGEIVVMIDGMASSDESNMGDVALRAQQLLGRGIKKKDILKILMAETGKSRNDIYNLLIDLD